jgi:hypothetical protein
MSDELIRALARQWAASNADEDGVDYITAQLRAGALSEEQVALAAYLGFVPAIMIHDAPAPPTELLQWAKGLYRWSREARVRIAVAATWLLPQPLVESSSCLAAAEGWLLDPSQPIPGALEPRGHWQREIRETVVGETLGHVHRVERRGWTSRTRGHHHDFLVGDAQTLDSADPPHHRHRLPDEVIQDAIEHNFPIACGEKPFTSSLRVCELLLIAARWTQRSLEPSAAAERVWSSVREEVAPWALGLGDPRLAAMRARRGGPLQA